MGAYESLVLVSWSITLVYHVLESFTRIRAIGLYVMPVVLVLLTVAWTRYRRARGACCRRCAATSSCCTSLVMVLAVGCLYVAGGAAIIYLIEQAQLKRRRLGGVLGRLPSLGTLDKLIYHATLLGLPFLTMGMIAGVIRAVTFDVPRWWTDPLVLLAAGSLGTLRTAALGSHAPWLGRQPGFVAGRRRPGAAVRHPLRGGALPEHVPQVRGLGVQVVVTGSQP